MSLEMTPEAQAANSRRNTERNSANCGNCGRKWRLITDPSFTYRCYELKMEVEYHHTCDRGDWSGLRETMVKWSGD